MQAEDRFGECAALLAVHVAQTQEQVGHDDDVAAAFPRAVGAFPMPLQPAPGIGQRAVLLRKAGRRQAEHFGLDLGGIDVIVLPVVFPEASGLRGQGIHDHEEFELAQGIDQLLLVGERHQRVEPLAEIAIDLPLVHQLEGPQHIVGDIELWQPVIAEIVVRGRFLAVHGLLEADEEFGVVLPIAELSRSQRFEAAALQIGRLADLLLARQGQIARDQIAHQPEIGQALNIGMTAQRIHAAAGDADVAEQQLDHRHRPDVLRALGVLGPAERVHAGHHPIGC